MAEPIVEIRDLRKEYRETTAVDGLDLTLGSAGTVHGFLGPNGSGKTTTIRCILNLIWPTSGHVRVFGTDTTKGIFPVVHRVGAIVENPKMFPKFSGRKNLSLLADILDIKSSEVDRVLAVVGLTDRGRDRFGTYSLGMKQRLAIAGALLKDPDLLILDEPANGLDPAGIAEMRTLIRSIADQGKAVLVSSHQLAEIEAVCDEVTIINQGRMVSSGDLETVRRDSGARAQVIVTIDDRYGAAQILADNGIQVGWGRGPNDMIIDVDPKQISAINKLLADNGRYAAGLRTDVVTLEQAFLKLTAPPAPSAGATSPASPASPMSPPPPPPGGAQ